MRCVFESRNSTKGLQRQSQTYRMPSLRVNTLMKESPSTVLTYWPLERFQNLTTPDPKFEFDAR
ncbi:hypothetical protein ColKHC_11919 [Colletotrichum higginsianum]|nr:hypothetical protein ColKHC_11919 [Colletotrichum higginsianum]